MSHFDYSTSMFPNIDMQNFQERVTRWYQSLKEPEKAQKATLGKLVEHYRKTDYGNTHKIDKVRNFADFQQSLPKINYSELQPHLDEVRKGNYKSFLSEPPLCWVMTRGSTGSPKILPATKTHLEQIFNCGSRALINFSLRMKDAEVLTGKILNLNFPSIVANIEIKSVNVPYGYSSGTYAKLNPMLNQVSLTPRQEEIDKLGSGISKSDWKKRFELVYQSALNQNVIAAMGVTPVILSFARYLKKRHYKTPKDLWSLKAIFCTSVRKIHSKYGRKLKSYYGQVPIVEMYTATEGVFGQQLDDLPYVSPNYDEYLFEVEAGKTLKMLHNLRRGEWGRLIISSCQFPRYDIGDMIEAMGKNYFRVFGRATLLTVIEHRIFRLFYGWFL
jgi:hypothetical protein